MLLPLLENCSEHSPREGELMNILLIGNGFDLMHGLPTKYENFLHTINFLMRCYTSDMKTIGSIMGNSQLHKTDQWISKCYHRYKAGWDNSPAVEQDIRNLIDIAKKNLWFSYLSEALDEDLGWIDFEKEVAFVVRTLSEMLKCCDHPGFKGVLTLQDKTATHIAQKFDFFHSRYDTSIAYVGATLRKVKDGYLREYPKGSGVKHLDKGKVISELYAALKELAFLLKEYLRVFVEEPLDVLIRENLIHPNPMFTKENYIITFNYTKIYEKLYQTTPNAVMHIHGDLSNRIVLGINPDENDDLETINTSFLQFKKYYQRVRYGTDVSYLHFIKNLKEHKKTMDHWCLTVVGHSLDATDKDILMELFDIPNILTILYHEESRICEFMKNIITMYGKAGLDRLRTNHGLNFYPLITHIASAEDTTKSSPT